MSDISTTELLDANNDSLQKKLHTALPAKVVSFNPDEQTVTIELMINPTYDKVEPQARATNSVASQYGGGTNAGFGAVGNMDFPEIP